MRFAAAAAVLALVLSLFAARPAAAIYEAPFGDLQTELQNRLDDDFDGVLDATQKRQQKACAKSVALIEASTGVPIEDIKVLGKVAKLLEKAYPEEMAFGTGGPLFGGSFSAFVQMYDEFNLDYGPFKNRVGQLAPSGQQRKAANLLKGVEKARASVAPDAFVSVAARAYLKAWKFVVKGTPVADAGTLLSAPTAMYSSGSASVTTDQVTWTHHSVTDRVDVVVSGVDAGTGDTLTVVLSLQLPDEGTEVSMVNATYYRTYSGGGEEFFDFSFGSATVTTLDLKGHVFEGSFSANFLGIEDIVVEGTFTATWYLEVEKD